MPPTIIKNLIEPTKTVKTTSDLSEANKLMVGFKDILGTLKDLKVIGEKQQPQQQPTVNPYPNVAKEMNPELKNAVAVIKIREDKLDEFLKDLFEKIPKDYEDKTLKDLKEQSVLIIPAIKPKLKEAVLQIAKIEYEK